MKILLVAFLFLSACAHSIHQVQVSDFRSGQKGQQVTAKTEQFVIMGFVTQTDYVDQAYKALAAKCPNGEVSGITDQFSTSMGFFSWTNKILLQGLCTQSVSANNDSPKPMKKR